MEILIASSLSSSSFATAFFCCKSKLVNSSDVVININGEKDVTVSAGGKLLNVLADEKLYVSSACGVVELVVNVRLMSLVEGEILTTELAHMTKKEVKEGCRLSCQVAVKSDMKVKVPEEVFGVKKWKCKVRSNENVATFVKNLVLEIPDGESVPFRAGGYIQIERPPGITVDYKNFDIPELYRGTWDHFKIWDNVSHTDETVIRAYSMTTTLKSTESLCST